MLLAFRFYPSLSFCVSAALEVQGFKVFKMDLTLYSTWNPSQLSPQKTTFVCFNLKKACLIYLSDVFSAPVRPLEVSERDTDPGGGRC